MLNRLQITLTSEIYLDYFLLYVFVCGTMFIKHCLNWSSISHVRVNLLLHCGISKYEVNQLHSFSIVVMKIKEIL